MFCRFGVLMAQGKFVWFCTKCDKIFKTEPKEECCKGFMVLKADAEDLKDDKEFNELYAELKRNLKKMGVVR